MGEWLSILYISKEVVAKELNTSGGVVKHPINIKKVVAKELNTSGGVVKHPILENDCLDRFYHFGKYIIIIFGHMLFRFITSKEALDCLHSRMS